MKMISWNVNGLRACAQKGYFTEFFQKADADIFCLQETKLQAGQIDPDLLPLYSIEESNEGTDPSAAGGSKEASSEAPAGGSRWYQYWNYAEKKGYSGTAIFTKKKPLSVSYGMGIAEHDKEGRLITLDMGDFYMIVCYTPNSQNELARLDYRMQWEKDFKDYLTGLSAKKPVVLCGDLNVAHQEIDLKNPKANRRNAGFTDEERGCMTELLASGFVDSFRYLYPDQTDIYSWWSYRFHAREKNAGWRIDYFLISDDLIPALKDSLILNEVYGSDHCPVELLIDP